ncbi:aldehyde dehydrogenase family protein [Nocardia sp. NPDC052278]|uniref:aldehyde dehydrogenase family protein n=1 Tax=unclassified Nocardia TaxID=2637762 RepID=UPI00368847A1
MSTTAVEGLSVPSEAQDMAEIVARSRAAQVAWQALGFRGRARKLRAVRAEIVRRSGELADAVAAETGKPATDALFEIVAGCTMIGWVCANAQRELRPRRVATWPYVVKHARVQYAPLGVVGVIAPWNYPVAIPLQSLPYALGAGSTVVFKPSEVTPETGRILAECFQAAGPGVVMLGEGDGRAGAALVRSGIDKLVFTGSPATGKRILAAAAEELLPVILELGGKDAMIVCSDADIRQAAAAAVGAAFGNAGQTCMASERVLAVDALYDSFVDEVVELTRLLRVGPGPESNIGRVTQPRQLDVVEKRLAEAVDAGAQVLIGGKRLKIGDGYFEPTVVVDVPPNSALWREESFAPVVSIARVRDDADAVAVANASEFGLNSSVFTRSRRRARILSARIEAGGVNINDAMTGSGLAGLPFGGVKKSGFGRLQGPEGLREFSRVTSVVEPVSLRLPSLVGTMFAGRRPARDKVERALRLLYGRG